MTRTCLLLIALIVSAPSARADAYLVPLTGKVAANYGYTVRTVESGKKRLIFLELTSAAAKEFGRGELTLTKGGQTVIEATVTITKDAKGNGVLKLTIDPTAIDGGELTIWSAPIDGAPLVKNFGGFRLSIADVLTNSEAVQALLKRGGPTLTVRLAEKPETSNWHYDLHVATTDGLDQHFAIRNGQPVQRENIRLVDINGDGFLDVMILGGKDHRGEAWFKTLLYDPKAKKYAWLNGGAAASDRADSQGDAGLAEKAPQTEARNTVLWKRLASVAIMKFLKDRKDLAALVAKRAESPLDFMEVVQPNGTAQAIKLLQDVAAIQHITVPEVDPKGAVVVYLNGPVGGAWRIGVIFDRADAATLAVVFIPGK